MEKTKNLVLLKRLDLKSVIMHQQLGSCLPLCQIYVIMCLTHILRRKDKKTGFGQDFFNTHDPKNCEYFFGTFI